MRGPYCVYGQLITRSINLQKDSEFLATTSLSTRTTTMTIVSFVYSFFLPSSLFPSRTVHACTFHKPTCSLWLKCFVVLFHRIARFCTSPVGMQNGRIKNRAITASSYHNHFHAPWLARLHRRKHGRFVGSWAAKHNNHHQFLQVDLGRTMKITGINTQGRYDASQWVTAYYVLYSSDGMYFAKVKHWWNVVKVCD